MKQTEFNNRTGRNLRGTKVAEESLTDGTEVTEESFTDGTKVFVVEEVKE
jgi:hypothetical protein